MKDETPEAENYDDHEVLWTNGRTRIVKSKVTGLPVIVSPPGTPLLTSERVRELLEDFP
jgi:hypothetical protein